MQEIIEYKGYIINIEHDVFAPNPFEEWEGLPSLLVNYDNTFNKYGNINISHILKIERCHVKNNLDFIKLALDEERSLLTILKNNYVNILENFDTVIDCLNDYIQEFFDSLTNTAKLTMLVRFLTIKNIPHLLTESYGYTQGNYCELLLVENNEDCTQEDLKISADLYDSWMWGNVYRYRITDKENNGLEDGVCYGGFYGYNHEKSGLIEAAKSAIDCEVNYNRRKRLGKLKELIKNKVALSKRSVILDTL